MKRRSGSMILTPHRTVAEARLFKLIMATFTIITILFLGASSWLEVRLSPVDIMIYVFFAAFPLALGSVVERATERLQEDAATAHITVLQAVKIMLWTLVTTKAALLIYAGMMGGVITVMLGSPATGLIGVIIGQMLTYLVHVFKA